MNDRIRRLHALKEVVRRRRLLPTDRALVVLAAAAVIALPAIVRADNPPSLPAVSGSMGATAGGIGADASTGTATAAYPIVLPPARGAIQPMLSLGYAHTARGVVTEVGAGWSLGLPSIERHHRLGGPPKFATDPDDIYRLSGARLVQVNCNGPIAGGSCAGEPMPHWSNGWYLYRPDVDSSHTRAFLKGNSSREHVVS